MLNNIGTAGVVAAVATGHEATWVTRMSVGKGARGTRASVGPSRCVGAAWRGGGLVNLGHRVGVRWFSFSAGGWIGVRGWFRFGLSKGDTVHSASRGVAIEQCRAQRSTEAAPSAAFIT